MFKLTLSSLAILGLLTLSGCGGIGPPTGPEQHTSQSIDLDKTERVRVELKMPVGEMEVRGGAAKLMEGDFTYNVPSWKPELKYKSSGGVGDLVVETGSGSAKGDAKNRWDLRLNDTVAMDIRVNIGAGEAKLNLGSLNLSSVEMDMGAGTVRLDLRGNPKKDYSVRLRGGVGEATVYLPKSVGVSATATGGIGEVSVTGLRKEGDHYVNEAYATATVRVRVDVKGGVGSIKLISE
ncbi:MAG: toast rack family protein [Bryobacteraceae bacterium]|nr:toast rack family protein [Bryobacteraceae bacterium]